MAENKTPDLTDPEHRIRQLEAENTRLRQQIAGDRQRTAERDLRSILDNLPSMVGYWSRDLRNRFANSAYLAWFGIDPATIPGRHIREILGEDHYRLNLPYIEAALRGEPQQFERGIPSPDGKSVRHSLTNYIPDIVDGEVLGFYVLATNITAAKQVEAALKATQSALRIGEERLRRGQEFANIGTWEWTIETGDLFWSERIAPLFGYPVGELATSYENFLNMIHPEDRQSVTDAVTACIESDAPYDIEHRVVWSDGTVRWLSERGAVKRDNAGKPLKMLGVVQDVTERMMFERELVAAREAADRANQAKSDFLSSMSHELRTPMNAIIGFSQMLEYDSEMTDDQQDSVHEILKAGRHLLDLINEVLDLAKIESGRIELSMEGVDLAALGEDCQQLIQPIADQAGIGLRFDLPPGIAVFADRVRLKQVLLNLLSNAIKYNRPGGSVRFAATSATSGHLRLAVTDTGPGIAPERIGDLFQPFNRLGAEASEIEGSGIGLTITRRLVDMMGGEMGVESEVGVGSTFWLELAVGHTAKVGAGTTAAESININASAQREAQVLAIDDNPANLKLIAQVMGMREQVHLLTAHTPELGIELALAHRPDLILLDINMPGMDGYQVLKVFQASAELRHIPVVAITANAMPRDIERGKAAGFTDYLTKPLDIGHFLQVADALLDAATILPPEQA